MNKKIRSFGSVAIILTVLLLVAKVIGFVREMILAYAYGTSFVTDAYSMAEQIPSILLGVLIATSYPFVSIYTKIGYEKGEKQAHIFMNRQISIVFILGGTSAYICILFRDILVKMIAPGFSKATMDVTAELLKYSVWYIIFSAIAEIFAAFLNCKSKFIFVRVSVLGISLVQMVSILLSQKAGIWLLGFGISASYFIYMIFTGWFARKEGHQFRIMLGFDEDIRYAWKIILPVFFSSTVSHINTFVDKFFASYLSEGSVAAMSYAFLVKEMIYTCFTMAIFTMVYPQISISVIEKKRDQLIQILSKSMNNLIVIFLPVTMGMGLLADLLAEIMFQRGEFGRESVMMTGSAITCFCVMLLPQALRDLMVKVYYAVEKTKISMWISICSLLLNIGLDLILIRKMGLNGLILASGFSIILTVPVYWWGLCKSIGNIPIRKSGILFFKAAIAAFTMGVVVKRLYQKIGPYLAGNIIQKMMLAGICVFIGCGVYYVMLRVFHVFLTKRGVCNV